MNAPVYGTKQELWQRLVGREARAEAERQERQWLQLRTAQLASQQGQPEVKTLKIPEAPSQAEQDKHEVNHLPPAPWCLHCLLGKSSQAPHASDPVAKQIVPLIQIDYSFLKTNGERDEKVTREHPADPWATTLYVVDAPTQNGVALALPTKSPELSDFAARQSASFVKRMAYDRVRLRCDGEPSAKALQEQIIGICKAGGIQVDAEEAPKHSSQSMGSVGKFQDTHQRQLRAIRSDLETRYGVVIDPTWIVWPWMVRHTAWQLERFMVRGNGATAYEDSYGVACRGECLKFGELGISRHNMTVGGKATKGRVFKKDDSRF